MGEVIRYSVSALRTQATCSARFYFRKLAKDKLIEIDPAYPLVFGSAVHKGIEMALKEEANPFVVATEYVQENLLDRFDPKKLDPKTIAEKTALMNRCLENFNKYFYKNLRETIQDPESSLEVTMEIPWRKGILKGVVDVIAADGIFADWKSGGKVPDEESLGVDPQAAVYYYIAQKLGMTPPRVFNYVYLTGKPTQKVQELDDAGRPVVYKSGPRKGDPRMAWDMDNNLKFTFQVLQDDDKVNRAMLDYIVPVAVAYENGIIYKNRSSYNCGTCEYRSTCPGISLPERSDFEILTTKSLEQLKAEQAEQDAQKAAFNAGA